MKRLLILSALLFSFNGWAQIDDSIFFTDDDVSFSPVVSNYDGSIVCFSGSKKIFDLDNLTIDFDGLNLNRPRVEYTRKDFFGNINSGKITPGTSASCNVISETYKELSE